MPTSASSAPTPTRQARRSGPQARIEYIDAIRGVASLMVLADHAVAYWFPLYREWTLTYVNPGRIGITAFFVVSGYVVGLTLSKQSIRTFAIRRFFRLFPVYWLTTLLYVLVISNGQPASLDFTLFVIAVNVTMLQGFVGVFSILSPAWTLGVEVAYYMQSMAAKAVGLLRRASLLGYVWLAGFAVLAALNLLLQTDFSAVSPLMLYVASLGLALYARESDGSKALKHLLIAGAVVIPPSTFALLSSQGAESWAPLSFLTSLALGGLLYFGFRRARYRSFPRAVVWLGAVSYALYLIHVTVIEAVARLALPSAPSLALVAIGSLAAAWALHEGIEKPAIALGRRLTRRRPPKDAQPE